MPDEETWVRLSEMRCDEPNPSEPKVTDEKREIEVKHSHISVADLPPEGEVSFAKMLQLLAKKRAVTPSEAYRTLADEFKLTTEQRSRLMDNGNVCHWENRVQWARNSLVKAGIMARGPRGLWGLAKL